MPRIIVKPKTESNVKMKRTLRKRNNNKIKVDVNIDNKSNNKLKSKRNVSTKSLSLSSINSKSTKPKSEGKKRQKIEEYSSDSSPKRQRKQTFPKETNFYEELNNNKNKEVIDIDINDNNNSTESATQETDIIEINLTENMSQYECKHCDQSFINQLKLNQHLRTVHQIERRAAFPELVESKSASEGRFKCGKCKFKSDSEAEMLLHSVNHTVFQNFKPIHSDEDIDFHDEETEQIMINEVKHLYEDNERNRDEMETDLKEKKTKKSRDNEKFSCPCCERTFPKYLLKKHIYIHTSEKPFRCDDCNKEFASIQYLKTHQKKHEGIRDDYCETCGAAFASKKSLSKHQLIHQKDRPKTHLCDVCGIAFYDKESLKAHTFRMHLPKDARKFKCQFQGCRYTCLYQHQLLEHQKVHSDDKPWACDQCEYTAKSKWTFKKHYRKHTKERPFKCPHCNYASGLSSNLTRHLRIHTGSKPFKCPYCTYSCNNHENLRKHVLNTKKHQGLYLYNCSDCTSFGTNVFTELRKHMEQTHSDIYTIEEIDRMISSIYHKHEDNTTVIPNPTTNSDDSNDVQQNSVPKRKKTFSVKKRVKTETNQEMLQMIIINPIVQQSEDCEQMVLPNDIEDTPTIYFTETDYNSNNSMEDIKNSSLNDNIPIQSTSEVIIIDSNVLEAEEICVSEQMGGKNDSHIVIAISK